FFRPLLCYTRNDIEQYAKKYNIPYVTDQTNTDNSYNRNFLRNDIFPRLTKINSNAIDNINRFASHIADDEAYLSSIADITSVSFGDECAEIPLQLLTLPRPIAMRIINKTLVRLGCTYDIESTHIEALLALSRADGGKQVDLPFGFVAYNDYDHITIERRDKYNNIFFSMPFTVGQTTTPCGIITVTNFAMDSVARWFDIDKIGKEAVIRNQLSGDVFQKFGSGTKKLVDFFTDKKIPYRKRNSIPLVAIGNEVLIVGDIEISEKIKGTTNSNVYYFNITKEER
ncbi:MAG: tRNA lysidine(34) synthetase TilS, partial [Clostridia bacterium]